MKMAPGWKDGWLVFAVALGAWLAYFYMLDVLIMTVQRLPVGWDLLPK